MSTVVQDDNTLVFSPKSALVPTLDKITRSELRSYFDDSWKLQDQLFQMLADDDAFYMRPDPLRNPLIFYFGHPAAFYMDKLCAFGLLDAGIWPEFDTLFARGVDPERPDELEKDTVWPSVAEVKAYRTRVRDVVVRAIETIPLEPPRGCLWALMMGIEHERLHWETTSVLLRQCPTSLFTTDRSWPLAPVVGRSERRDTEFVAVPSGPVVIGKPLRVPTFGWDNEYGHLKQHVPAFEICRNLTTNSEYLQFVTSGGYATQRFWCDQGWRWKSEVCSREPRFWVRAENEFRYRATFDEIDLPMDWPVEVNHFQAEAYCRWLGKGARLPSEAEYRRLFSIGDFPDVNLYAGGYNNHLRFGSPTPVGMCGEGVVNDQFGNVWQLLSDDFYPLPGFASHPLYPDFSSPYFGSAHGMMAGGSWATTGTAASPYYRLWFRRFFFQHAGFRVARSAETCS